MGRRPVVIALLAVVGLAGVLGAAAVVAGLRSEATMAWAELERVADPRGKVLAVDVVADGTLWRLTAGRGCHGCEVLWRRTAERTWEARGGVPSGRLDVSQLRVADDEDHLFAAGEGLWASDDGGLSWSEQTEGVPGMQVGVLLVDGHVVAHLGADEIGGWAVRAPLGSDDWEPVDLPLPTTMWSGSLRAVDGVLLVQNPMMGYDADIAYVSSDLGESWNVLDLPCWTVRVEAGPSRIFSLCDGPESSLRLLRGGPSTRGWVEQVSIPAKGVGAGLRQPRALSDDLVLGFVTSGRRHGPALLAADRILWTTLPGEVGDAAVAPDGTTYVVARGRLLASTDGRRWQRVP